MIVLVDMDGVLADYEQEFSRRWKHKFPDRRYISSEESPTFRQENRYPLEFKDDVENIARSPGFFYSLLPIPGGLEALSTMRKQGIEAYICTKPSPHTDCIAGKHAWIEYYLGTKWVKRTIFTRDKTMVKGDILIDDRPSVEGVFEPTWEHVLYNHPYNRHVKDKRSLSWNNWRDVLGI